jgi:hypothetical protein
MPAQSQFSLEAWGLKIDMPQRPAHNTDGMDLGASARNATITQSFMRTDSGTVPIE